MGFLRAHLLFGAVAFATALAFCCPATALEPSNYIVADDLHVTSAVQPGLIKHPIMATLDDTGRLFVAESSGTNYNKAALLENEPHSIVLLTDTDKDGVFDKATTFADKMTFPQGALWIYDSLYVMSPPGLWYLEDADGDGVAEKREQLVTGFDFTGNAADVHGPFLHPNGRLYWCHGRKGHEVRDPKTDELVSKAKGARIWSCQLDGGDVRVHAGGGMDNPVEIDFTDTGDIIGSVNLFYGRPRGDVLVHWLHGGTYPRHDQQKVVAEFFRTGPLLKEVHNFGHVAVSGMCRYRTGLLNPDWKDQWLVSHFNSNQVTRTRLKPEGSSFMAQETEPVFQLTRPNSHLTDVLEDRNGDLLVLDTGGWFRSGCPTSQIARPDVSGGIYRIAKKDRPYVAPKYLSKDQWEKLSPIDVAEKLDDEDEFLQTRSITELAIRGHSAIPELRAILEDEESSVTAKRNSVWALARMSFSDSPDLIFEALKGPDQSVQIAACNALSVTRTWQSIASNRPAEMKYELDRNKRISGALAKLVRGAEPVVACNAAVALGTMAESRAIGSLLGRAGRGDMDRALQHALTYSLIEMDYADPVIEILKSDNPGQQIVALWALQNIEGYDLEILDVLPFFESDEEALRHSVVEIAKVHPEWDAAIANRFFEFADDLTDKRRALILELAPAYRESPSMLDFVGHLLTNKDAKVNKLAQELIPRLGTYKFPDSWEEPFRNWLTKPETQEVALDCLHGTSAKRFEKELALIAEDGTKSPIVRVKALRSTKNGLLSPGAFILLQSILEKSKNLPTRTKAVDILTLSRLTADQRTEVARFLRHADPIELSRLMKIYRRLDSEEQAKIMADSLAASPGLGTLNLAEVRGMFSGFDSEIRSPIDEAVKKSETEKGKRKGKMKELVADLKQGDAEKGKLHFAAGKGACILCHKIGEVGRAIGPDLSKLANIRQPLDFVESILYPSESIARDFDCFVVTMNDESQLLGLIQTESENSVSLTDLSGTVREINRTEIKSIQRNPQSLMPQGLELSMPRDELLDLVSYLMTLK